MPIGSYLTYAQNANNIVNNSYDLNANIITTIAAYSNLVTNYLTNSNIYSRYGYLRNDETYNNNTVKLIGILICYSRADAFHGDL